MPTNRFRLLPSINIGVIIIHKAGRLSHIQNHIDHHIAYTPYQWASPGNIHE